MDAHLSAGPRRRGLVNRRTVWPAKREVNVTVCAIDGVRVAESRAGRLVHTEEIPKGIDPDHEIVEIPLSHFCEQRGSQADLVSAVQDLLLHHATLHPLTDCEFAARVTSSLRSPR